MAKPLITRQRQSPLAPREQRLVALLQSGPKTIRELAEGLGVTHQTARSYLSRLAKEVPIIGDFAYGHTTYRLAEKTQ
jgi:predicted ArsR family transcriptional regulator